MSSSVKQEEENTDFASKWRQNRACARCRRLKMKCSYDDPSHASCKRCFTIGVECSFDNDPTAKFAKKKRRKVMDESSTILNSLIQESQTSLNKLPFDLSDFPEDGLQTLLNNYKAIISKVSEAMPHTNIKKSTSTTSSTSSSTTISTSSGSNTYPFILFQKNLIKELIEYYQYFTIEEARTRFDFFIYHMLPYYPAVGLSKNFKDFDNLYENYPLLLTACISVTAVNDNKLSESDSISNSKIYQLLNHYLYNFIAYYVHVKCDDFSIDLIYVCLILSSWCLPPNKLGHFRNQLNSLTAFNISLCIDLGEISKFKDRSHLSDDSDERNSLRALLSVYCCCGSLELSLRRFKLVTWTKNHDLASQLLMKSGYDDLPSSEDKYLCYFSKIIATAQEILEFVSPLGVNNSSLIPKSFIDNTEEDQGNEHATYLSPTQVKYVLNTYERKLDQILDESGFMKSDSSNQEPKEKYVLCIMYYQLLIIIYDNLISGFLSSHESLDNKTSLFSNNELEICLQHIIKLIKICESLVDFFVKLNSKQTVNYPTVLYYRPMHALILMVRLRLVLKSQKFLSMHVSTLEINVEGYFNKVSEIIIENEKIYNSEVCVKMKIILNKIERWMKVSNIYKARGTNGASNDINLDLVKLISMSKDQEIESLDLPKDYDDASKRKTADESKPQSKGQSPVTATITSEVVVNATTTTTTSSSDPSSVVNDPSETSTFALEKIFQEIDADIMHYLNPLESDFNYLSDLNGGSLNLLNHGMDILESPSNNYN
ncbi:hypothetical protein DFJ63DRAFT_320621 [Scheffersomyces coipomensis]|uniref:uncharacterized protein n=1 Tax=Scheffersomyces coipomensis TaxID=1788519 RepID=UPI00315C6A22